MSVDRLYYTEGLVTPECSKTHISFIVHLYRPHEDLRIHFSYEPKKLEDPKRGKALIEEAMRKFIPPEHFDASLTRWESYHPLNNLLTLSFDDENGFRGAGHRHDPVQELRISQEEASPGLIPGTIPAGQLRITISIHCIVTPECRYKLEVWGGENR